MQTNLPNSLLDTPVGKEADRILRSCVHCGFCTATCPTYLETGNELDSPRGRIYLVKELLESGKASGITRTHLDRCLSCQACETTCPSNVEYHQLLNIGRAAMQTASAESWFVKSKRSVILGVLGSKNLFTLLLRLGRLFRFALPKSLARQLPEKTKAAVARKDCEPLKRCVVLLNGCVQGSLAPNTNIATARVLEKLKIDTITIHGESCCGAMHFHTNSQAKGMERAKHLTDQLFQALEAGAEVIISTASGCGNFIKDYPGIFLENEKYRIKATRVAGATRDISEFLAEEDLSVLQTATGQTLAFHSPCTLQHGQKLAGLPEKILEQLGYHVPVIKNSHLCCGSAGTYSLFQPAMATQLRDNKLHALAQINTESIATANIGCQCHLTGGTEKKVRHWIEYLADSWLPAD